MLEKEMAEVILNHNDGFCQIKFKKDQGQVIDYSIIYQGLVESNGLEFQLDFSLKDFVDQWRPWATSYSISGDKFVLNVEWAEGQGGVLILWDLHLNSVSQITSSPFPICSFYDPATNVIVSFHYIQQWDARNHHYLAVTPVTGMIDTNAIVAIDLQCKFKQEGVIAIKNNLEVLCARSYTENEYGPLGIFFDKKSGLFYAHDMGNLYIFAREDIFNALRHEKD